MTSNDACDLLSGMPQPLVIAEIGARYGSLDTLKQMIRLSMECGADVVKFQTFQAETISTPGSYFTLEDGSRLSQFDFFERHELTAADHSELIGYCDQIGIKWFSTPSHAKDVELLELYDPIAYKIGSDDLTNLPFLEYVATKQRPMIVSTGMSTLGEIERAVECIIGTGNHRVILMHCVVSYPAKTQDANLRVITSILHELENNN